MPDVKVTITQRHVAVMDPPVLLLRPYLQSVRKSYELGGATGYRQVEETFTLYDLDHRGRLAFGAGLLPRLLGVLQDAGYSVHVDDQRRDNGRMRLAQDALDTMEPNRRAFANAVVDNRLGQIEVRHVQEALDYIVLVGRLFPDARIAVGVPTRQQAHKLWKELTNRQAQRVGLAMPGSLRRATRWMAGTLASLPRGRWEWDILILPFGEESTGTMAIDVAARIACSRIYAFVHPQRRQDKNSQLTLEQIAGPVVHRVAAPRTPVRVVMVPTPQYSLPRATTSPLDRKRHAYWRNQSRNRLIAQLGRAVVAGDREALGRFGLNTHTITDPAKVVILVESPPHGWQLAEMLRGWQMVDMRPTAGANNSTIAGPTIMTTVYAAMHGINADVVIRADGTEWPLHIKGFPPRRRANDANMEIVIVDLEDTFDAQARTDTRRRAEDYRRSGMHVVHATGAAKQ